MAPVRFCFAFHQARTGACEQAEIKENYLATFPDGISENCPPKETVWPHTTQDTDLISLHQSSRFAGSLCGLKEITLAKYSQDHCFTSLHLIDEEMDA